MLEGIVRGNFVAVVPEFDFPTIISARKYSLGEVLWQWCQNMTFQLSLVLAGIVWRNFVAVVPEFDFPNIISTRRYGLGEV